MRRGVTVAGEVKNYVPVTPEMLRNPPPGDWLIFGRNYQRHSYSPLNQITRDNVKNLQLKWTWAMNDSGANQTTPIVHNGIIYLASPSNIVQALDGKTGDLIWETRVGPDQAPGYGGIRSIAIAEDKIFLPTSDAHMVAIDARNGKILWDTPASDKPHVSTSGDIVIGDKVLMGLTGCARFDGEGCYISAFDIHTGQTRMALLHHSARRAAGQRYLGQLADEQSRGRGDLAGRQLRSRTEPHLLGRGAVEALELPEPPPDAVRQDALCELDCCAESGNRQAGVVFPACAGRIVRSR